MKNRDIEKDRIDRGKRLADMRMKLGLTKSEFHRLSGISRPQMESVENGTSAYTIDTYIRYLHALKQINQN